MNSILVPTVICPGCHAELEVHRETCPHCRTSLRVAPAAPGGLSAGQNAPADRLPVLDRPWVIAVLLLHVGFLGIPVYWKTRYSVQTRLIICLVSVLYTVFAVGAIWAIGAFLYRELLGG